MSWAHISNEKKLKRTESLRQGFKSGRLVIHNKLPMEVRICECTCNKQFTCKINSKQRFIHGHNNKKVILMETRICPCPCKQSFECKVTSKQIYAGRGHATRDNKNPNILNQRKIRAQKIKGHITWNKGLTIEDPRVAKNSIGFQRCNKERKGKHTNKFGKTVEECYGEEKGKKFRIDCSNRMKKQYANFTDEQKSKYLLHTILKCGKHPNNFELKCKDLLNIYYPNEFEYCGQGKTIIINGRNPDFIHKTKKIVILCHGIYWHMKKFGIEDTIENRRVIELEDSKPFRAYGYEVWVIWEDRIQLNKVVIVNTKEEVKQDVEKVCIGG